VLEDGKPQKVQAFGMVDIPNTRLRKPLYLGPNALPIEPDVAVNKQVLDGRLYLIVLDDYHVAPLRSQNVRQLARRFVLEKLGPDDQAAVVVTSGLTRASQDFTQNRRLLIEAIDNFVGQKLPSSAVTRNERSRARDQAATDDAGDTIAIDPANRFVADDRATERMFQTRQALNSLRSIAEWMSAIQGRRKAIIYLSEGVDFNMYDIFRRRRPVRIQFRELQHGADRDVGHRVGRLAQQRPDLFGRSRAASQPWRRKTLKSAGSRRGVRARSEAADAGAADLAGEPADARGGNRRCRVCRPQRLRRGVRSHRAGKQRVLRPGLLLHE
jgi:VWFA-related protein